MAEQIFVTVENVKNPSVKRRVMTEASAKINSKTWRIVGTEVEVTESKKKEVAKNVVTEAKPIKPVTEPINEEVETANEFASIGEADTEIETLRAEYETKSGKPADKRWKADKLNAKIAEL